LTRDFPTPFWPSGALPGSRIWLPGDWSIDELQLEYPFAGSRMLQGLLLGEGYGVGRLHVATLMKRMGIEALYRKPNTSRPEPGHKIDAYLLRKLPATESSTFTELHQGSSRPLILGSLAMDCGWPRWHLK
jgi:hypothetical protein